MSITYDEKKRLFWLNTPGSTYVIGVFGGENWLGHLYYGKKIGQDDIRYLARTGDRKSVSEVNQGEKVKFCDSFFMEYPTAGIGDYREPCLNVRSLNGHSGCRLSYFSYKIYSGKKNLDGLPATFGAEKDCTSLELLCKDEVLGLQAVLNYTVFEKLDVITRSVQIQNISGNAVYLTHVLSACLDMDNESYDLITLNGDWAGERMIFRRPLAPGKQAAISNRGVSSHQANPFLALVSKNADQENGTVYGMNFVYSGNFLAQAELTQYDTVRAVMGILPENFCWRLKQGEVFQAPEAVLVYSDQGIGKMTRTFHDLYRKHLIRGKYKNIKRPVLINNWEATYFDFDADKILAIAREASEQGIEMLVLDDGWFGERYDDSRALGDWQVNEEKLRGSLSGLADEINGLGMKFGLWFEPEMVSPDSDLYREHPDWAIRIPEREPAKSRKQLVLDITRKEVRDTIYEQMRSVLHSANIEYVKWDMNRNLCDLGSYDLDSDCQGELSHRYVLALYEMQERLITEFPELLLENCSSGGGRFDPGMLYYSPQIWCSDNTDAVDRLRIQEGTALVYPLSSMGSHVADCPGHMNGRTTPFETRGYAALTGTFGYELDITRIPEEDRSRIPEQIALYHKYNELIREGDYYRIASCRDNHKYDSYMVVSKDRKDALVFFFGLEAQSVRRAWRIGLRGLDESLYYRLDNSEICLSGATLMNAGMVVELPKGDYRSRLIYLRVRDEEENYEAL